MKEAGPGRRTPDFAGRLRRMKVGTLGRNATALYGVHVAGLLLPLVTVPYLARVLRPEGWGMVLFAQSFAAWLTLVLEYGFYLSGTRMVAQARGDQARVARIVAGVQAGKALLLLLVSAGGILAYGLIPAFGLQPGYLLFAWLIAVAQGFNPFWYFQGTEWLRVPAILEVTAKAVTTAGVFVLVKEASDGWLVLAMQAATGMLYTGVATLWMYRQIAFRIVSLGEAIDMLRSGGSLFIFRTASGLRVQANVLVLGLLTGPGSVAFFGGAERIIRGAINLIHPASQALYPRMSHLIVEDRDRAGRLFRSSLLIIGGLGVVMGVAAAVAAPVLVRVLLGPGYESAVPVLRLLALLPPLVALNTVLGTQWALPMGMDRPLSRLVIAAGLMNVLLAALLIPRMPTLGMAAAVVLTDAMVTLGLLSILKSAGGTAPLKKEEPVDGLAVP
jgi:PST family polysaccharide transporter